MMTQLEEEKVDLEDKCLDATEALEVQTHSPTRLARLSLTPCPLLSCRMHRLTLMTSVALLLPPKWRWRKSSGGSRPLHLRLPIAAAW